MTPQEALHKIRNYTRAYPTLAQVRAFLLADGFRRMSSRDGFEDWERTSPYVVRIRLSQEDGPRWHTLYHVAKRDIALHCCYRSPDMADELMAIVAQIEVTP